MRRPRDDAVLCGELKRVVRAIRVREALLNSPSKNLVEYHKGIPALTDADKLISVGSGLGGGVKWAHFNAFICLPKNQTKHSVNALGCRREVDS